MLEREFLALTHQTIASSKSSILASIRLCFSTKVVLKAIPKLSHMLVNVLLAANSPPLSVRNLAGDPNKNIQLLKTYLMIVSGCLLRMTADAESLLQWSTICGKIILL